MSIKANSEGGTQVKFILFGILLVLIPVFEIFRRNGMEKNSIQEFMSGLNLKDFQLIENIATIANLLILYGIFTLVVPWNL